MSDAAVVRKTVEGVPADARGLVRRYRNALADALTALASFGYESDAADIATRYGFVYIEPKPEVRLSQSAPVSERLYDEITR